MELIPGVYETLVSTAIERKLSSFPADKYLVKKVDIDSAESCGMLSDYLAEAVCAILKNYFREQSASDSISAQVEVVNRVLHFIETEWKEKDILTSDYLLSEESKLQFLRGIYSKIGYTDAQIEEKAKHHPISGYRVSSLFTGGNDISIDSEIYSAFLLCCENIVSDYAGTSRFSLAFRFNGYPDFANTGSQFVTLKRIFFKGLYKVYKIALK